MSAKPAKKDALPLNPAPSVFDAVNASRGARGLTPVGSDDRESDDVADEEPAASSSETTVADEIPTAEVVRRGTQPAGEQTDTASVAAQLRARRQRSEATLVTTSLPDPEGSSIEELGTYVTQVMRDARTAASQFLASVDADAARRAATISAQAEIQARSLLDAAQADADKIRADARLEADRQVAERLRGAIDLTDRLYNQAEQILADADRPDVARRNLARFVTALTQTAEDAAAAASEASAPGTSRRTARG